MALSSKDKKAFKTSRARMELTLRLIQFCDDFKSKEEPTITLTKEDKMLVFAELIQRYFEKKTI